jgi:nitrate reductase gamma subunit
MVDAFLLIALPYTAVLVCVFGSIYRYRRNRFSYSALSSQFLESKKLVWGSVPWHTGLLILLLLHLLPLLFPAGWSRLVGDHTTLMVVEIIGMVGAFLALIGLVVLFLRRLTHSRIQAVTSKMDLVILALFLAQVLLGIMTATSVRWGAQWMSGTTTPYLRSLLTFNPDMTYVSEMPALVKAHIAGAWLIILLIPFSRLVHIFSLPLQYIFRAPQRVIWNNPRRAAGLLADVPAVESRRLFLKGITGLAAGGSLLSIGVMEKVAGFYRGPKLTSEEEAMLLERNLQRLKMTAEEKELELERLRKSLILVAQMSELQEKRGKYFIDYQMRPALAFLNPDGLPLLISAKCTHLGCTVQADMNEMGQILCPCHVSWFDANTGVPDPGAPAKIPLPVLGWVAMDADGNVIASKKPGEPPTGTIPLEARRTCSIYIAKEHAKA